MPINAQKLSTTLPAFSVALTARAYITVAADLGKIAQVTSGASDATITLLSPAIAGANALQAIQKMDDNSVTITGAANNGGGLVRLAFTSAPGTTTFHTGDLVKVNGMAGVPQNGTWACTVVDSTHIDLQGSTFSGTWTSGGTIKSGQVIVTDGVNTLANLYNAGDIVWLHSTGSAWQVIDHTIAPWDFVFAANAPWTVPKLLGEVEPILIGSGAGGGSGISGLAGGTRAGGAAGATGYWTTPPAIRGALLTSATYPVVVGAPAAGGAAVTATVGISTNGNPGTAGNDSTFFGLIAYGGSPGAGGTSAAAAGGSIGAHPVTPLLGGLSGRNSTVTATPTAAPGASDIGGSNGGGGITAANAGSAGGDGSQGSQTSSTRPTAGVGGVLGTNPGGNGGDITDTDTQFGGSGAGGGGSNPAAAGGDGGNGGTPGGAGGGGGAGVTLFASGAGGTGARGEVRLKCRFG